jgi:small glutamine-rich tetratricopeptide repeat-containing protein alpha
MAHAHFCMNDYADAVSAYEKGLALDPENATMKQSLETARKKVPAADVAPSGGGGGMPDMAGMMNNPAMMGMAQQMMSNPAMAGMMNNPAMMEMAKKVRVRGFLN